MTDFKAKMHQIRFRLGQWDSTPDPALWSLQRSPDPLAGFRGRFAAGGRGWAGEEEGKWREGRDGEVEGEWNGGPQVTVKPGPLRALLRHWLNKDETFSCEFVSARGTTAVQKYNATDARFPTYSNKCCSIRAGLSSTLMTCHKNVTSKSRTLCIICAAT